MSSAPTNNTPAPAAADKDAKRRETTTDQADYALPEAGAFSLVSLALAGDISVARNRPGAFVALQRLAGNRAVAGSFQPPPPGGNGQRNGHRRLTVQRQTPAAPASVKSYGYNGISLSTDKASVRKQMEAVVERGGLDELRTWFGSWGGLDAATKNSIAAPFDITSEEVASIDAAVISAKNELEDDAKTFKDSISPWAQAITEGILDESQKLIEGELERYGIREEALPDPGGGGAEGAPPAYDTQIVMDNVAAGQDAQKRAKNLALTRRAADKAMKAYMDLVQIPGYTDIEKIVQREIPELETRYKAAEQLWKMQEDLYAEEANGAVAEFPVLAIYASGGDAATKLENFAKQPPKKLGETLWREAKTRLDNIEAVREGLGGRFNPLQNERIVSLVLGKEDVKKWQKRVGEDHVRSVREKAEQDKMFWSTLAIGLGIISAIPTGGASLVATGLVTAAAVASAGLSVYNAYEHWRDYQMQSATSNTAFAKAQSISQEEPSFFWLALEIVGAGLEVVAAGAAFKALVKVVKEARDTRNILKAAEAIDKLAPPAGVGKIKATVAAELGPEAVNDLIKAEGVVFRSRDIARIEASLQRSALEGWTEAYRQMASTGKIRPLTEDTLEAVLGSLQAQDPMFTSLAAEYISKHGVLKGRGLYDHVTGTIFVKPGSQDTVANWVAHELVHAGQARLKENLNGFWAEFEAFSAQKRIINKLDKLGVGAQVDESVAWLREADDAHIAMHIRQAYGYAIPKGVGGFGEGDKQIARAAMEAAKKVLALPGR